MNTQIHTQAPSSTDLSTILFDYQVDDGHRVYEGTSTGVSSAQAIDRARVDFIYTKFGALPSSREFTRLKSDADTLTCVVNVSVGSLLYFQRLKRTRADRRTDAEARDFHMFSKFFKGPK